MITTMQDSYFFSCLALCYQDYVTEVKYKIKHIENIRDFLQCLEKKSTAKGNKKIATNTEYACSYAD